MEERKQTMRVRFAPSPTGFMHVGSLRMALTDFLLAKKFHGAFVLRIEDTDQKRFVDGAVENLARMLAMLGLQPDEGVLFKNGAVVEKGEYGPYTQSQRLCIYQKYVDELLAKKKAYHCFCTPERLESVRAEQMKVKRAPKYDRHCRSLSEDEVKARLEQGESFVVRMAVPDDREICFTDLVRGTVKFHTRDVDDQVLLKSDGFPTYHLAVVVDDHLMQITHIIRGEEWLSSTPKHVLLYESFGWDIPEFAHLPLLLNADRSKLSKRQGDVAVEDYLAKGYLKEALLNFVALLGWNPGKGETREIFSLEELIERFDLSQVNKAGAVFDLKKLDWMNAEYIKKLSVDELYEKMRDGKFLEKDLIRNAPGEMQTEEYLKRVLMIERERLAKLSDVGEQNLFFFATDPVYDPKKLNWKENTAEMTKVSLTRARDILSALSDEEWAEKSVLEKVLMDAAGEKRGDFLWPLRFALTGADKSPSPFDCAWVLGRDESLKRVDQAITLLS